MTGDAQTVERNNSIVKTLAIALGLDDNELDELFWLASKHQ